MGSFHGKKERKNSWRFFDRPIFLVVIFITKKNGPLVRRVEFFFLLHGKHDMAVCNSALKSFFSFFPCNCYKTLKWFFVDVIIDDGQGIFSHLFSCIFFLKKNTITFCLHHHLFSVLADSPIFWLVAPKLLHWVDTKFFYFWK